MEYTCDGSNVSPPLTWKGAPLGTRTFAVICVDRDAPSGPFVHWMVYNIPRTVTGLPMRVPPDITLSDGEKQGRNGFNRIGYGGPCPSPGNPHRYFFSVYALDSVLSPDGTSRDNLLAAMKGHLLAEAQLIGTY